MKRLPNLRDARGDQGFAIGWAAAWVTAAAFVSAIEIIEAVW